MSGKWNPEELKDDYTQGLREVIDEKKRTVPSEGQTQEGNERGDLVSVL